MLHLLQLFPLVEKLTLELLLEVETHAVLLLEHEDLVSVFFYLVLLVGDFGHLLLDLGLEVVDLGLEVVALVLALVLGLEVVVELGVESVDLGVLLLGGQPQLVNLLVEMLALLVSLQHLFLHFLQLVPHVRFPLRQVLLLVHLRVVRLLGHLQVEFQLLDLGLLPVLVLPPFLHLGFQPLRLQLELLQLVHPCLQGLLVEVLVFRVHLL